MLNEIWKKVPYYEGYEVSNYGRVRSIDRYVIDKNGVRTFKEGKYLTKHDNGNGYLTVTLSNNGKYKQEYVHRIVALAFIPNPDKKPQVNHKDEDKQNNYIENLEWVTCKENNNYGTHTERVQATMRANGVFKKFSERMKENNPNKGQWTRGNNSAARKVICEGKVFDCIKDCAEYYGIGYGTLRGYLVGHMSEKFKALGLAYFD